MRRTRALLEGCRLQGRSVPAVSVATGFRAPARACPALGTLLWTQPFFLSHAPNGGGTALESGPGSAAVLARPSSVRSLGLRRYECRRAHYHNPSIMLAILPACRRAGGPPFFCQRSSTSPRGRVILQGEGHPSISMLLATVGG